MQAIKSKNRNSTYRPGCVLLMTSLFITILFAWQNALAQEEDAAKAILKSMSDYVSSQKKIEFTIDSSIEVITPQLEKIQFTNTSNALLSRPDKFRVHRVSGHTDVEMYFDGKTVSIYGKEINAYAQFEAPGNIDQLIAILRAGHGVAFAGSDLLLSNSYEVLVADVMEAKHIGRGIIDGRECEHLAFRNFDTDWQLWVEVGDKPIPRKLVISSKTINSAPQYTLRVSSWNTDINPAPDAFIFIPPENAQKIESDALIMFDELPHDSSIGETR